ncbi:MAG: polysaccharide deacetylase family protein [Solirubrobacteraceae bacterium]
MRRTERKYARRRRSAAAIAVCLAAGIVAVIVLDGSGGGTPTPARRPRTVAARTAAPRCAAASKVVPGGVRGSESVPILMYHVILPAPAGAPYPGLYVTPSLFAAQMHALAAAGYHAVTLNEVWDNWHYGTPLPPGRPIVISFDNGYESQYREALPVMRSLGWVGVENLQLSGLPPSQGGLSEREVRALVCAGWELDTQGYSHADLPALTPSELTFQVATARKRIRALYHVAADWFCYPSGQYDAAVVAAVRAAGFRGSTTVVPGWASPSEDPYRLPRLRVLSGTSPQSLLGELDGIRDDPPPGLSYIT